MTAFSDINSDELLQMLALTAGENTDSNDYDFDESFDDDDEDDESFYSFDPDFDDDDDDDDESYYPDYDDDDDDDEIYDGENTDAEFFGRRRRRRRRNRKLRSRRRRYKSVRTKRLKPVRGAKSTVLRSANGQRMRVKFGSSFAKAADVNKLIKSTQTQFLAAKKARKKNHDALASQISSNTKALNSRMKSVNSRVKKLESSSQTAQLMSFLTGPPEIKTITVDDGTPTGELKTIKTVDYKSRNMLLPLLLSGMGGSGDNSQMLMMAMMMNKDDDD